MTNTQHGPLREAPVEGCSPLVDLIPAHALVGFRTTDLSDLVSALRGEASVSPSGWAELADRLERIRDEAHERFVRPSIAARVARAREALT
jgi:hypothetical protein